MAKEKVTMVEGTLAPEKKGGDSATIQIRSTDVERFKKVYGARLSFKGKKAAAPKAPTPETPEPEAKKAPPAKNKARSS